MICIYIDESGDLGFSFKKGSTSFFTVAALMIKDPATKKKSERIIKKARRKYLKKKGKQKREVKFSNSSKKFRIGVLTELSKLDVKIFAISINKHNVIVDLKNDSSKLYNWLMKNLLMLCFEEELNGSVDVHFDHRLSGSAQEDFKSYILLQLSSELKKIPHITINHTDSVCDKNLQVVDFVCGSLRQAYEKQNLEYHDIIKNRIEQCKLKF